MSYELALKAAGAEVQTMRHFGTQRGDWWARVAYEGNVFWVYGSFGSCTICDDFDANYEGWRYIHQHADAGLVTFRDALEVQDESCYSCKRLIETLADFGKFYLDDPFTQEQAVEKASKDDRDMDADDVIEFLEENAIGKEISNGH